METCLPRYTLRQSAKPYEPEIFTFFPFSPPMLSSARALAPPTYARIPRLLYWKGRSYLRGE